MYDEFPGSLLLHLPTESQQVIHAAIHEREDVWLEQRSVSQAHSSELDAHLERHRNFQRRESALTGHLPPMLPAEYERLQKQREKELKQLSRDMEAEQENWRKRNASLKARLGTYSERMQSFNWMQSARELLGLARHSGQGIKFVGWRSVFLKRGQNWQSLLNEVRSEIEAIEAEAERVRLAPIPKEQAWKRIEETVDIAARRGRIEINPRARSSSPVKLHTYLPDVLVTNILWACAGQIKSTLREQLEQIDFSNALTDEVRDRALIKLADRRLDAERREEGIIRAAHDAGEALLRRPDADPRAVLGVSD